MGTCSFLTELYDPDFWPERLFGPASGEAHLDPTSDTSTFLHIHYAASDGFYCHILVWLAKYSSPSGTDIQRRSGIGYLSAYGAVKKLVFLKFKVQKSHRSLIIHFWYYLILSLCKDKIILKKVFRSFLILMKYFYFDGISLFLNTFRPLGVFIHFL